VSTQPNDSVNIQGKTLNRQIAQYSVAAAMAGVSMLALAQPAAGEVVVTRKTIHLPVGTISDPMPVGISLSNNGVNDISLSLKSFSEKQGRDLFMSNANRNNGALMGGHFDLYAVALPRGANIGPVASGESPFFFYAGLVELSASSQNTPKYCEGYFGSNPKTFIGCGNPKNKFLGVSFQINGQTHYGWIRLSVTTTSDPNGSRMSATVTGYAYETVPNKPILAGTAGTAAALTEKSSVELEVPQNTQNQRGPSLGMLAIGADALPMWRREGIPVRQ
jgi:hypothetical protein